jgi:hypothetical protein
VRALAFMLSVFIYVAAIASAHAKDFPRNTDLQQELHGISTIAESLPELDTLECKTRCDGQPACAQFTSINSCLDNDLNIKGCNWSCD